MRQERPLFVLLLRRYQRAAMGVCHRDKACRHIVAEDRNRRRVAAVAHRQRAAGAAGVF